MHPSKRSSSPRASDIKAQFEAKRTASHIQQPRHPQITALGADMSSSSKRVVRSAHPAPQPSIDSVIDSVPANAVSPAAIRPHTSKHPSWVGPKPPSRKTSSIAAMKQPVTIVFSSPGLRPPVYIGTDLTDPQWEPVEMGCEQTDKGEYTFYKSFTAEEGEYQYKLRLGPGDWWICDDSQPKIDDGAGNENNLMVVSEPAPVANKGPEQPAHDEVVDSTTDIKDSGLLFRHETLARHPASSPDEREADFNHDYHDRSDDPPLLRHESIGPSSQEQNHSPLFRHESTAIDNKQHDEAHHRIDPVRSTSSASSIPQEADPNDPSLEKFPTDHRGIMEHLDRTRSYMQADETSNEPGSPAQSLVARSDVESTSPTLFVVREDAIGELEPLREEAEEAAEAEAAAAMAPEADVPGLRDLEVDNEVPGRPAAPITPPDTPKEVDEDKQLVDSPMETHMGIHKAKKRISEKTAEVQERYQENAEQVKSSALSGMILVLSCAVALASAGVAWWYFKAGGDKVVVADV